MYLSPWMRSKTSFPDITFVRVCKAKAEILTLTCKNGKTSCANHINCWFEEYIDSIVTYCLLVEHKILYTVIWFWYKDNKVKTRFGVSIRSTSACMIILWLLLLTWEGKCPWKFLETMLYLPVIIVPKSRATDTAKFAPRTLGMFMMALILIVSIIPNVCKWRVEKNWLRYGISNSFGHLSI